MRQLSGKFVLVLAIGFGLAASMLAWKYLEKAAEPEDLVPVVVAATDITPRTGLTKEMLKIQQVPESLRHPKAYTSFDKLEGKVTKLTVTSGEQMLETKIFAEREESGLAFVVPKDKRAVSVGLSEVIGSGGLIVPGDKVDVIAVFDERQAGKNMSAMVLQDVEVLAVAQFILGDDTSSVVTKASQQSGILGGSKEEAKADPKAQPTAKSVTLAVSPEEAQRLVLAEEKGKIRLALRSYGDVSKVNMPETILAGIKGSAQ